MLITDITDAESLCHHFRGVQLSGVATIDGRGVLTREGNHRFPKEIFDEKGSYQECCAWFAETESRLRSQGHSVHTYTEEGVTVPRKRMLVNLPDEAVAYMEANNFIFLTDDSENVYFRSDN